jgi:hypothetical protein
VQVGHASGIASYGSRTLGWIAKSIRLYGRWQWKYPSICVKNFFFLLAAASFVTAAWSRDRPIFVNALFCATLLFWP